MVDVNLGFNVHAALAANFTFGTFMKILKQPENFKINSIKVDFDVQYYLSKADSF